MGPLFFIVWGTKVRVRPLGARAEFCPGCLRVTRHDSSAIEHAKHVYYINGSWREQARLAECCLCGAADVSSPDARLMDQHSASGQSIDSLITATNPDLRNHLGAIARQMAAEIPEERQNLHILNNFCARHTEEFASAEHDLSGWMGIVLILFIGIAVTAFVSVNEIVGYSVSALLLVALIKIRSTLIHRRVAKSVRPQLASLLNATGIDWQTLETTLQSGELNYPKLRRHLNRSTYDTFRMGQPDDAGVEFVDFLVPQDDGSSAATIEEASATTFDAKLGATHVHSTDTERPRPRQMTECQNCGTRVMPKADGTCPSCNRFAE